MDQTSSKLQETSPRRLVSTPQLPTNVSITTITANITTTTTTTITIQIIVAIRPTLAHRRLVKTLVGLRPTRLQVL